ncbi:MAG: hypothetical protein KC422_22265 [Trueperaceae bacterium]|nr:hypothetical protein [Trueperaceae bacterium]
MLRPRKKPNLLNYLRIKDFAASAGVTERAVQAWLSKPKLDPEVIADVEQHLGQSLPDPAKPEFEPFLRKLSQSHPQLFRRLKSNRTKCLSYGIVYSGRAYISLQGAERFLTQRQLPRVAQRSKDGLTVEAALDILPYSKWKLYKAIFSGQIKAVIHSQTIYLDRQSVKQFKLEQQSLLPLPGWVLIRDAAKTTGRSYTSLKAWLDHHQKPTRIFMHPRLHRPCRYMKQTDLNHYQSLSQETAKHIPKRFR